jgi:hypothetical protein
LTAAASNACRSHKSRARAHRAGRSALTAPAA